jgi:hypothetical protein
MLDVVESCLCFCCPGKFIYFSQHLIEGESVFAELADETAERRQTSGQLQDMSKHLRWLHVDDRSNLLWVSLDSSLRDEITQELTGWYTEGALFWVELDAVAIEVGKSFPTVGTN